jgi:GR25 family glycosyltransferase involved in LPS biosynthesis
MELFNTYPKFSIFLERLNERLDCIKKLEEDLQTNIQKIKAVDGNDFEKIFTIMKHIRPCETLTKGMIGCTLSHMKVLQESNSEYTIIFEDDCVFQKNKNEFELFMKNIEELSRSKPFDILCLGASEIVDFLDTQFDSIKQVYRFWGTHALIVKNNVFSYMRDTVYEHMKDNIFIPADWLYSMVLIKHNLVAYAPTNPKQFFYQKTGLRSSVNNSIRQ